MLTRVRVVNAEQCICQTLLWVERRIGNNWKIELESRWSFNVTRDNPLHPFKEDNYLTMRLRRYF